LYACLFTQIFVPPRCHRFNYHLQAIARPAANDFKDGAMNTRQIVACLDHPSRLMQIWVENVSQFHKPCISRVQQLKFYSSILLQIKNQPMMNFRMGQVECQLNPDSRDLDRQRI
jgi:hypothetical protein